MKTREVVLFTGEKFTVPQGLQRIDSHNTHGWQVRYQGTKYFGDGSSDGSGARRSFERATRELMARIASLPAPVTLRREPSPRKMNGLPPGISGPILAHRNGSRAAWAVLSVLLPRFGGTAQIKRIYIGTQETYTLTKYRAALKEAKALRAEAIARYETDATRARRREARDMRRELRGS
jgi:hypothetical protein